MPQQPRWIHLLGSAQRRLHARMTAEQAQHTHTHGATAPTPTQAALLWALSRSDGATMGMLAQTLDLVPSAVSGLVQRMRVHHWVTQRNCPDDARTQRVWLQPKGRLLLPQLQELIATMDAELTHGFSPAELAVVVRWLTQVQALPISAPPLSHLPCMPCPPPPPSSSHKP
jgi:DNA-binding MarR family transcriptional regulator